MVPTSESAQRVVLAYQSTDHVPGCCHLSLAVFSVGDSILDPTPPHCSPTAGELDDGYLDLVMS